MDTPALEQFVNDHPGNYIAHAYLSGRRVIDAREADKTYSQSCVPADHARAKEALQQKLDSVREARASHTDPTLAALRSKLASSDDAISGDERQRLAGIVQSRALRQRNNRTIHGWIYG